MGDTKNQKHVMVALEPTMGDHVLKQFVNTIYDKASQKVTLVHCVEYRFVHTPVISMGFESSSGRVMDLESVMRRATLAEGEAFIKRITKTAEKLGIKVEDTKVLVAHPPKSSVKFVLCDYIKERKPHMVVCGAQGKSAPHRGHGYLGSVSDFLTHNAPVAIMVIRGPSQHGQVAS
eukprot:CAMPEP_0170172528 /NCGR_PEP_ID=MMETSP0040_2-20121228/5752_1 /TAXON_ID=641309 /ORGANISM="Lotharella oceanica, Strain CCMP622" /LENGTH=175 /DNA_ID=CAMNT_0010413223 /DNA_START=106 /DNA_END=633 /DNA_ORIENTATION=+